MYRYNLGDVGLDIFKKFDWVTLLLAFLATVIGMIFIYSATKSYDNNLKYIIVQGAAAAIGMVLMFVIIKINYENLSDLWPFLAGAGVFLLVLVLIIGIGESETGTRGWIRFGSIGIQPSEIVKICFIITLSKHLSTIGDDVNNIKNVILLILHLCVPLMLILMQPDTGTALVYIFIFIVCLFVAGIDWRYILAAVAAGVVIALIAWFFLLDNYQIERFLAFLNPEEAAGTYGYHVVQSKIAVGAGKIFGTGFGHGVQTQMGYLPAKETDFIFAVIGEEAGMIGCVIVVLLLVSLITRTFFVGINAKNSLGEFIAVGVAAMWLFHTIENIGMTIGLVPVTGIPLPFFSYGGSSILTNYMALGLVLSVSSNRKFINVL